MAPAAMWSDDEHFRFDVNNSWRYEVEHFLAAIEQNRPVTIGTSHDALVLMQLVDKVYAHG
jgi:predicted dehydrogenase